MMDKQMWIYAARYYEDQLTILSGESHSEYYVPLGSIMLNLPDDLIPNDETWKRMCYEHDLKMAQRAVVELEVKTEKARQKVRDMMCLGHTKDDDEGLPF